MLSINFTINPIKCYDVLDGSLIYIDFLIVIIFNIMSRRVFFSTVMGYQLRNSVRISLYQPNKTTNKQLDYKYPEDVYITM